jgi:hypothetical protein
VLEDVKVTADCRKFEKHIEEFHDMCLPKCYCFGNETEEEMTVNFGTPRETTNMYKIAVGNPDRKKTFCRCRRIRKNNALKNF